MNYLLTTAAYSNPELLERCVRSWPEGLVSERVVYLDGTNHTAVFGSLISSGIFRETSTSCFGDGDHKGVSGAWNRMLNVAFELNSNFDAIIVVGSDTEMKPRFLEGYIAEFEDRNLEFAVGSGHVCWNCWCLTRKGYGLIGQFDENMFPAYMEDNDYHTRVIRAGLPWDYIGDPTLMEHYGSATINLDEHYRKANDTTFQMNGMYYRRKWGGMPGAEVFEHPFNNQNMTVKDWELNHEDYEIKRKLWSKV